MGPVRSSPCTVEGLWGGAGFRAAPAMEVTEEVRLSENLVKLSEPKLHGTAAVCYKDSHKRDGTNYAIVKAFFFFFFLLKRDCR